MENNPENLDNESLISFDGIFDIFERRKKIIIFATSLVFSISTINTISTFIRKPIYRGSFTMLIKDPIDPLGSRSNSIEEKLALNNVNLQLPTLIQYLKSQYVLNPVEKEMGIPRGYLKNKIKIMLDGEKPFISTGILKVYLKGSNKITTQIGLEKLSKRFLEAAKDQRQLRLRSGLDFLDAEYPEINKKTLKIKNKITEFRKKYNVVDPLNKALKTENEKNTLNTQIKNLKLNNARLKAIKEEISINSLVTEGFFEQVSDLGIELTGSDQQLLDKFKNLRIELADKKTKFKVDSSIVGNIQERINSLYPLVKAKQLSSIDLALKRNDTKITLAKKKLENIKEDFKIQPDLLSDYEKLIRDYDLSVENLNSLINAKESFQLQLAQKSLPWRIIEKPEVGSFPISPNIQQDSIKNLLTALFISLGLALIREISEKTFTSEDQIEKVSNSYLIPFLGFIPFIKNISKKGKVIGEDDNNTDIKDDPSDVNESPEDIKFDLKDDFVCSESFRSLATRLKFLNTGENTNKSIIVTSSRPSEGKTTITSLIAKTFADLGNKVLLIDADMRRPSVHKFFGVDNINGLSNLITDSKNTLKGAIIKSAFENLDIITAGISPPDPVYLLSSKRMDGLSKKFIDMEYDYVIYDAPPSEALADAKVLSSFCDLTLFVVSLNLVNKASAKKVIKNFLNISRMQTCLIANYLKDDDNFLNNYGYKYRYNNGIYGYYDKNYKEIQSNESTSTKVIKLKKLKLTKKKLIQYLERFKAWIDF